MDTFSVYKNLEFFITDASICDTLGNLLFYTNGSYIANRNHDTLHNSKDFNSGYLTDVYYAGTGLGIAQGALVLPVPGSSISYYVFNESAEKISLPSGDDTEPLDLRYSIVDMALDNGLGGIENQNKRVAIVYDTLSAGRITSCKHANGRDWWVIVRKHLSNKYYKLLVAPDSITVSEQSIGFAFSKNDALGMAVFSPTGELYAHLNNDDTLQIMKFDRCNGEFSDPVVVKDMDSVWTIGCQFSPSGRYLYVSSYLHIFQFDMQSPDIPASKQVVATYEEVFGSPRWFSLMQLAPDNKIYVSTYGGNTFLHVIDSPDSFGIACNVIQSGIVLPSYNSLSLPNFPNYALGALQGSDCDTLYLGNVSTIEKNATFRISPNPVSDWLNIVYSTQEDGVLNLLDVNGRRVAGVSLFNYFKNRLLNVSQLPAGVYLAVVTQNGEKMWNEKVVVVH